MKIQRIDNVSFCRKPNPQEMVKYTKSLNQGLKLLDKDLDLILHNSSAPSIKSENTGIGSLFSKTSFYKLFPFLKTHAFSNIQQEPNGLRQIYDNSPYAPESNTKNIFMIPLEKLASDEYGNILSKATLNKIVAENPSQNSVNYQYIRKAYDVALKEAYTNGKNLQEFLDFKSKNESKYEQSAIYRILSNLNQERYFEDWNEIDKNLYIDKNSQSSKNRIAEIKNKYSEEYNYYIFQQMILEKETQKANAMAEKTGLHIIGDSPVASTKVDNWVNQNLYLKDRAIGCPPDYFSPDGQKWGFKFFDPEKIFDKDGNLGEAGKILQKRYEEYFSSFSGGIRIDHIIGLIDPFIYTVSSSKMTPENSGRIFSQEGSKYKKQSVEEFGAILSKIIIPAAQKYGLDKSAIICEDLGKKTPATAQVMKALDLSGIAVTQFDYRGSTVPKNNTIMLGSHDNQSFLEYINDLFNIGNNEQKKQHFLQKTEMLAEDTYIPNTINKSTYLDNIRKDKHSFLKASFVELFTSPAKRVQIFFTDLWGLGKTYNRPGTTDGNWSLRLDENFESDYYDAVKAGKAPNLPEIIAQAIRHRGLDKTQPELMQELDASSKILYE